MAIDVKDNRYEVAHALLSVEAVTLSPDKPYHYSKGGIGPCYCDNRLLLGYPRERSLITGLFTEKIRREGYDVIAGTATAGIPWAAFVAERLGKPMIYVRGEAKQHGKKSRIEGPLSPGQSVVLLEDLINSGGSSVAAVEAIREAGGIVKECIAIVTYGLKEAEEVFRQADCKLDTLTNIGILLDVALQERKITPQQRDLVLRWQQDPKGWAKKEGFA